MDLIRYQTSINICGHDIPITISLCSRSLKEPVWMARYVPPKDEENRPIWFGYINDKGKFVGGRKPKPYSRSVAYGSSTTETAEKLRSWLEAAYMVWYNYNDYRRTDK